MEFDKSKVYTLVNADEVKVGSKGYFADNVKVLKEAVLTEDSVMFGEVEEIFDDFASRRFGIKDEDEAGAGLFYLVEEPKEKNLRPYKDTEEMIDHFCRHFNLIPSEYHLPMIWVRDEKGNKLLVHTVYRDGDFLAGDKELSLNDLCREYTYLDGSPCGIEELYE